MKNENVMAWARFLQSTSLPQARMALGVAEGGKPMGFCCLGIGCKVAGIPGHRVQDTSRRERLLMEFNGARNMPPAEFHEWLGTNRHGDVFIDWPKGMHGPVRNMYGHPVMYELDRDLTCAGMNDNLNLSFAQIGDIIAYFGVL